jgi:hypothetical protein
MWTARQRSGLLKRASLGTEENGRRDGGIEVKVKLKVGDKGKGEVNVEVGND